MSDKWYTYPEDESPEQQGPPNLQRRTLLKGVLLGFVVTLLIMGVAWLIFGQQVDWGSVQVNVFEGEYWDTNFTPRTITMVLVFLGLAKTARNKRWRSAKARSPEQRIRSRLVILVGLVVVIIFIALVFRM